MRSVAQLARLPRRGIIELTGRDAFKFLQGSITNDVHRLERKDDRDVFLAAFLNPQGRMLADALFYTLDAEEPAVLLEVDSTILAEVSRFIKRFKLRSKVKIRDASAEWDAFQIWGDAQPVDGAHLAGGAIVRRDTRAPTMGWRMLLPVQKQEPNIPETTQASEEAYEEHRILCGVPEGAEDIIIESSLPLESCVDYMNGVDFQKGCYIGQELTARTHYTGIVRKRIVPVFLAAADNAPADADSRSQAHTLDRSANLPLPPPGTDIRLIKGKSDADAPTRSRSAGKLLSSIHNIALALLRLEQVEETLKGKAVLQVEGTDGQPLRVHASVPDWWPKEPQSSR